ncbi:hypothetical protein ACEQ8H_007025 [Pleosporales sp. CAS-2024a]
MLTRTTSSPPGTAYPQSASFRYPQPPELAVERLSSAPYQTRAMPMTPESANSLELQSMKSRIMELEEMLSRAVNSGSAAPSLAPSSGPTNTIHIRTGLGSPVDVISDTQTSDHSYPISRAMSHKNRVFGQSHWMNSFVVMRDAIEFIEPHLRSGMSSLPADMHRAKKLARTIKNSRCPPWPTIPTNDLPLRSVCDALVHHYLKTIESLYRILHVPSFQKTYEELWSGAPEPAMSFMVQLKLVLAIGTVFYDEYCSMRTEATRWIYEAQTWLSSPDAKSKLGIEHMQTSILCLLAREFADVGSELVWISAGALLREAMYIGLHKDPCSLPRMNFYQTEMRRRIWNTILELNLQFSLISGGACLISLEDFNTEPPGNYDDEELTRENPQHGPGHILTQTSSSIALRKTFPMRLTVVKFLNDVATSGTFEETLGIDAALKAAYKTLRQNLQTANVSGNYPFASAAIDFIMHRYISSLHLPYFNPSLHQAIYAFSRKTILDTSLKLWKLGYSPLASSDTDLVRLCRGGAGFFRAFTFHACTFLAVELRTQLQDDDDCVPRPDLLTIAEEGANYYLQCMEAGETGIKGYLLLRILGAQIDAIKQHLSVVETQALMGQAADDAIRVCVSVLERLAGNGNAHQIDCSFDFDGPMQSEFFKDCTGISMMTEILNFQSLENIDSYLS